MSEGGRVEKSDLGGRKEMLWEISRECIGASRLTRIENGVT